MSALAWLAHSEAEKRKTLEVIRLLEEPGTVDDLGIGGIRDAFSELLFPGVSVIQSRVRYFLFIPWIYRVLERKAPIEDAAKAADRLERRVIAALNVSGEEGVIGARSGTALKTVPSFIYWRGLSMWGIRLSNTGRDAYLRRLERTSVAHTDDEFVTGGLPSIWHPELPDPPEDFPDVADFSLTYEEADYLRDRIMTNHPGTLLASLVSLPFELPVTTWPWGLVDSLGGWASAEALDQLHHAHCFAVVIHGVQLLYNIMLAEAADRPAVEAGHRATFAEWVDEIRADRDRFEQWSSERDRFWAHVLNGNPRLRFGARRFADQWFDMVLAGDPADLSNMLSARQLVAARQSALKGRLAKLNNPSALESWLGSSGADRLGYRWGVAQVEIRDITEPLRRDAEDRHGEAGFGDIEPGEAEAVA